MPTTLVLGGARSGKTAHAQNRAESIAAPMHRRLVMIATAQAFDAEMSDRIARHQADRDDRWTTVEAPLELTAALAALTPDDVCVVDCLTLWLSNQMLAQADSGADIEAAIDALVGAVVACPAELLLVSNEVGWGIVPDNALARAFRDHAGRLHQRLAKVAEETVLIVAGLPLRLN